MGFFSSPTPEEVPTLPKLSQERLKAIFDQNELKYFVDNDGDLGGMWDNSVIYFMLRGEMQEILVIQGRFHRALPLDRIDEVREFLNAWNRDKFWPKTYHRVTDDGEVVVTAEHNSDWEDGITDDQLAQTLHCAIATTHSLFAALSEEFGLE